MADNLPKSTTSSAQTLNDSHAKEDEKHHKKSLYQRYMDAKTGRNIEIPDEELVKYTGMTKAELHEWAKDRPGVGGNQPAGKLAMGQASGVGGYETAKGYGGWGPGAEGELKFPNKTKSGDDGKGKGVGDELDEEGKEGGGD
ncbi:hypothetical protein QBC47DRAFT_47918 [Echria macrotheca]|uniref:Uncharacterized protein n=1 Tax=Echria macrotheca TaxID=438768 RepID=A0AAJ0B8R3_9PEZI|nr:hypothetical protein QBC47DRAFT_47918 [Echria macrotheca]